MNLDRPKSWPLQRAASATSPYLDDDVSSASSIGSVSSNEPSEIDEPSPVTPIIIRRPVGKGKEKAASSTQKILPVEILETILYYADPETFASLILVNRKWREASESPNLYMHQLSRCPANNLESPIIDTEAPAEESLTRLKRDFAREVKRNLFEAFLQPRRTIVSLVSSTTSSSAAFPLGEAFDFSFSPNGHWTLALSSSRIYVIDTKSRNISVRRELKVLRRPIGAAILDDGSTLVVLSSRHVNLYDLSDGKATHKRSTPLDNTPHALAVTPRGDVLAIAFPGGVELHSLAPTAGDVDRRSVRCDRVDTLRFSNDGTMLLGTTRSMHSPYTVVLTAPYYIDDNQDMPPADVLSHMWTSQIIFPHSSRDCSHAALLSNRSDGDATWTFTFDRVFESFRAVRTDDLRNGTTYFTGPRRRRRSSSRTRKTSSRFAPTTLPAPSQNGELVATGFYGKDVWIYGVPQGLDQPVTVPRTEELNSNTSAPSTPISGPRTPTRSLSRGEAPGLRRLPRWEVLLDKYRNVFAKGRQVAEIPGISSMSWVEQELGSSAFFLKERLVVAAPGGVAGSTELGQDGFGVADGGRLIILDFDRNHEDGTTEEITFDVGTDKPEILEEEFMDLDTEVELVRRRTRRQSRPVSSVADALAPPTPEIPPVPIPNPALVAHMRAASNPNLSLVQESELSEPNNKEPEITSMSTSPGLSAEEASAAFDGPYSQGSPRSRQSLYRSATAVAGHRERNPPPLIPQASRHIEFRRPDGRGEIPHESDADNWVPPPPPYKPKADIPLPDHLKQTLLPKPQAQPAAELRSKARNTLRRPQRATTMHEATFSQRGSEPTPLGRRSNRSTQAPQATPMNARSVSESLDRLSGPAEPTTPASSSSARPHTSSSSTRRPVSVYVGKLTHSLSLHRKRSNPKLQTQPSFEAIPPLPPLPTAPDLSLPSTPIRSHNDSPVTSAPDSPSQHDVPSIPSLPSAEQLVNLSNRSRAAPPPQSRRQPSPVHTSGGQISAPPRGALGAAGSPSSPLLHGLPRQSQTQGQQQSNRGSTPAAGTNSPLSAAADVPSSSRRQSTNLFASRSTPTLPRPRAKRLDTIESIGSRASVNLSRSRSGRAAAGDRRSRSASIGPALRLDGVRVGRRATTGVLGDEGEAEGQGRRRGILGFKRRGKGREGVAEGGAEGQRGGAQPGKEDGKCVVM